MSAYFASVNVGAFFAIASAFAEKVRDTIQTPETHADKCAVRGILVGVLDPRYNLLDHAFRFDHRPAIACAVSSAVVFGFGGRC